MPDEFQTHFIDLMTYIVLFGFFIAFLILISFSVRLFTFFGVADGLPGASRRLGREDVANCNFIK